MNVQESAHAHHRSAPPCSDSVVRAHPVGTAPSEFVRAQSPEPTFLEHACLPRRLPTFVHGTRTRPCFSSGNWNSLRRGTSLPFDQVSSVYSLFMSANLFTSIRERDHHVRAFKRFVAPHQSSERDLRALAETRQTHRGGHRPLPLPRSGRQPRRSQTTIVHRLR